MFVETGSPISRNISNYINSQANNQFSSFNSIIGIGNPIIDFSTSLEKEDIQKFNLSFGQTIFCNEQNQSLLDNINSYSITRKSPGGSIMNTLRVCSWCLNKAQKEGEKEKEFKNNNIVTMLGAIGDDSLKESILHSLNIAKVQHLLQIFEGQKTSRCGIILNNKEKCLIPDIQASKYLSMEFIKQNEQNILNHDILLIEGYYLKENYNVCQYLCEEFKKRNKLIIMNINDAIIVRNYLNEIIAIGNNCDIIYGNIESIKALININNPSLQQIFIAAHKIFSEKNRLLLINCHNHGVYCSKYNYQSNKLDINMQCFPIPLKNEEIKDLIGDGSAFLGGFLAMFLKGNTALQQLSTCCKMGYEASNEISKNIGCTFQLSEKF